jgi:flagellar basal body-associated protein FliL
MRLQSLLCLFTLTIFGSTSCTQGNHTLDDETVRKIARREARKVATEVAREAMSQANTARQDDPAAAPSPTDDKSPPTQPAEDVTEHDNTAAPPKPATVEMQPFLVNLDTADSARFLKLTLHVELKPDITAEVFLQHRARVRDRLTTYLSSLRPADVQGSAARTALRQALMDHVDRALETPATQAVLITDFVVQ